MVQSERNKQTVEEGIKSGAEISEGSNPLPQLDERTEHDRPDQEKGGGNQNRYHSGYDDRASPSAEEGQPLGQFRVLEAVVAPCSDQSGKYSDERILYLEERQHGRRTLGDGGHEGLDEIQIEKGYYDQP